MSESHRRLLTAVVCIPLAFGAFIVWWLSWLSPLVPSSGIGWVVAIGSGFVVVLWGALGAWVLWWLQSRTSHRFLSTVAGVVVALSLGAGVFGCAYMAREFMSQNFTYFGR